MPFPEVTRVKYSLSPLENVICQIRFPVILEIDSENPFVFQNLIRDKFPVYEERNEVVNEFNFAIQDQMLNPMAKVSSNKTHIFKSEDGFWSICLNKTFLSISVEGKYSTWEDFFSKFEKPISALCDTYKPAYFTRIGLRYEDVFCRSVLNLDGCSWSELIKPEFLGLLGSSIANVSGFNSVHELLCKDLSSRMRIISSLVRKMNNNEECLLLDSDTYAEEKIKIKDVRERLNYLHDRSSRLLRYAITDKLHNGMVPNKL